MRILFRLLEEAEEHPTRFDLLLEVFGYLAALGAMVVVLVVQTQRGAAMSDQAILVAVYLATALLGLWKLPRYAGRMQFLAVVIAAGFLLPPPRPSTPMELKELEAQGKQIVQAIEQFRQARGRYPGSLTEAGIAAPETAWGIWKYRLLDEKRFVLVVGDPARRMVAWDSREGWIVRDHVRRP
jgi:hypothetical protein